MNDVICAINDIKLISCNDISTVSKTSIVGKGDTVSNKIGFSSEPSLDDEGLPKFPIFFY